MFATAGKDHVATCVLSGNSITKKMGKAKEGIQSQCSIAWINNPQYKTSLLSGGSDGKIYHWTGDQVTKLYENNKGSVHSVSCRLDPKIG